MSEISLIQYGPFVVGNTLPHKAWKIEKIVWQTESNMVQLHFSNGYEKIIKERPYSEQEHRKTDFLLEEKKRKEAKKKEMISLIEEMRNKLLES